MFTFCSFSKCQGSLNVFCSLVSISSIHVSVFLQQSILSRSHNSKNRKTNLQFNGAKLLLIDHTKHFHTEKYVPMHPSSLTSTRVKKWETCNHLFSGPLFRIHLAKVRIGKYGCHVKSIATMQSPFLCT